MIISRPNNKQPENQKHEDEHQRPRQNTAKWRGGGESG